MMHRLRNFKLYRWLRGGVWILHSDSPEWVQGKWMDRNRGYIYDERSHYYHKTLISIIEIEDYTK